MWFQNYYLSLQKQLKQKVMEKQKSFEQIINEVSASIVNNRKVLDGIVDDIFQQARCNRGYNTTSVCTYCICR